MIIALSANVCDSARLRERLGETEASHAIERCIRRMERSIAGHHGQLVSATAGELRASFDAAEQACQAAVDMQKRVATLPPVSGIKLPIRIGLHCLPGSTADQVQVAAALRTAAQVAALAANDQILSSVALIEELPRQTSIYSPQQPGIDLIDHDGGSLKLAAIAWRSHDEPLPGSWQAKPEDALAITERSALTVRYRDRTFVVDAQSASLTIGRDPANQLVIGDRKVSRSHGLIERRHQGYFYVDRSSNGSQVRHAEHAALSLRRQEIELRGSGRIYFGGPADEAQTEFADFETS